MSIHGVQQQSSWLQRKRADAPSSICRPTLASSAPAKKGLPCEPGAALPDSLTTVGSTPIGLSLSLPNSVLSPNRIPLDTRQPMDPGQKPRLGFAGGGVFFFWQLGVVLYLREVYDLTQVEMAGASCGAICATLAACGVEPEDILEAAVDMAVREKVWERSVDVLGTIGPAVQEWLDALLPDDAHLLLRDRVEIVIGRFPNLMDQFAISDFTSKEDVIQANMASAHVPFVLDARPLREFRGQKCVDGSFADFINYQNSYYLTRDASVVFDYTYDTSLQLQSRLDFLRIRSYEEILEMVDAGRAYAERLHREGALPLQV